MNDNINEFLAKPKKLKVLGKTFMVTPFTISELGAITKSRSDDFKISSEGKKELVFFVFKKMFPEITMEQFNLIAVSTMDEVMYNFYILFESKQSDAQKKLIDKLKANKETKE